SNSNPAWLVKRQADRREKRTLHGTRCDAPGSGGVPSSMAGAVSIQQRHRLDVPELEAEGSQAPSSLYRSTGLPEASSGGSGGDRGGVIQAFWISQPPPLT